jgi:hypothetical protein
MNVVVGLVVTVILGFLVGFIARAANRTLPTEAPSLDLEPNWDKLRKIQAGGCAC